MDKIIFRKKDSTKVDVQIPLEQKLRVFLTRILGEEFLPDEINLLAGSIVTIVEEHREEAESIAFREYYEDTISMLKELKGQEICHVK